jgi:glycosyltransferase involved in cell wall biosynthesis
MAMSIETRRRAGTSTASTTGSASRAPAPALRPRVRRTPADEPAALRIAVLIPCYNEAAAIGQVVRDFRAALPDASIYVYDNNSTDATAEIAADAGAAVRAEPLQGKGNVVRRMFADVEADIYVMVDGDDTYEAAAAPQLVATLLAEQLDMVCAGRGATERAAYRPGHRLGNRLLNGLVARVFGRQFRDMLTGYRVLSRRFVKSFPALSRGFEIETELSVHALELRMKVREVATAYRPRGEGSCSKLSTVRDGWRILRLIVLLIKEERPLLFFSAIAALFAFTSLALATPVILEFLRTGLVPRLPTAVLSTGLMLVAMLALTCGLVLDTVTLGRREAKRLHYLGLAAPAAGRTPRGDSAGQGAAEADRD